MGEYTPMVNDRRDFDPMGEEWSYILDSDQITYHHPLVAPRLRAGMWPFARKGSEYRDTFVRLSPDWTFYAWGHEYVLAGCDPKQPHLVRANASAGSYGAPFNVDLDLRKGTWNLAWGRHTPTAGQQAEAEHKAAKLLAYLTAECARRDESQEAPGQ